MVFLEIGLLPAHRNHAKYLLAGGAHRWRPVLTERFADSFPIDEGFDLIIDCWV